MLILRYERIFRSQITGNTNFCTFLHGSGKAKRGENYSPMERIPLLDVEMRPRSRSLLALRSEGDSAHGRPDHAGPVGSVDSRRSRCLGRFAVPLPPSA